MGQRSVAGGPGVRSSREHKGQRSRLTPKRVTAWPAGCADVAHSQSPSNRHVKASSSAMVCCRQPSMMRGEVRGQAL